MSIVSRPDMDQSQSCKSVGWNISAQLLLPLFPPWDGILASGFCFLFGILGMEHPSNLLVPNITMDHKVARNSSDTIVSHVSWFLAKGSTRMDIIWVFLDIWILGTSKDRKKVGFRDIINKPLVNLGKVNDRSCYILEPLPQLSWTKYFEGEGQLISLFFYFSSSLIFFCWTLT